MSHHPGSESASQPDRDPQPDDVKEFTHVPQAEAATHAAGAVDFVAERDSAEFEHLRSRFRTFAFPMTVAFMVWYLGYVLASTFAVEFMSTPVLGHLNVGLLWGLAQFATTFLLTFLYVRHANKNLDPHSRALRQRFARMEGKI